MKAAHRSVTAAAELAEVKNGAMALIAGDVWRGGLGGRSLVEDSVAATSTDVAATAARGGGFKRWRFCLGGGTSDGCWSCFGAHGRRRCLGTRTGNNGDGWLAQWLSTAQWCLLCPAGSSGP
jgi:hypothetical protein